jgi:Peptidase A4 family
VGLSNSTWAGYEVVPAETYHATYVNATWRVPEVTCTQEPDISVLIWVGLGGQAFDTTHGVVNNGLEQIGTRIDCVNGLPIYSTWYELYPTQLSTMHLPNIIQKPGDNVTASVSYSNSTGEFTLELTSSSSPVPHPLSVAWANGTLVSAEWIVEAPGSNYTQPRYILPDFGNVTFRNCFATVGNHTSSITGLASRSYSSLIELSYVCLDTASLKAIPYPVTSNGTEFGISWVKGGTC